MSQITRDTIRTASLLSSTNRVEAPFVRVVMGSGDKKYTFGVYEGKSTYHNSSNGSVKDTNLKYPNYVQNLVVKKYNGTVNQYKLKIVYPIGENDDPNFFEKLLSSVSDNRKIEFTYGDSLQPEYIYDSEEAIITNVESNFNIDSSTIDYTIEAVSTTALTLSGNYTFPSKYIKPSSMIMSVLYNPKYHLTEVFKGMKDKNKVEADGFISQDDSPVQIPTCTNISALEYISTLVSYMNPIGSEDNSVIKQNIYSLTTYEDTTGEYGGSYFKVQKIQKSSSSLSQLCTYEVDIGYKSGNVVSNFRINNNKNWSIYYNYNKDISNSDYLKRIGTDGKVEYIYSPQLTGTNFEITGADVSWWTKVTQYPIDATMTIKGLLRPAILMSYVKINIWYWGHKHIASGYYIIKSQEDNIGLNGYYTTLSLMRVSGDEEII